MRNPSCRYCVDHEATRLRDGVRTCRACGHSEPEIIEDTMAMRAPCPNCSSIVWLDLPRPFFGVAHSQCLRCYEMIPTHKTYFPEPTMADTPDHDPVNSPSHYTAGGIETIDFIEAKQLNFNLGNAVKYISRAGVKDPAKHLEDLKKAAWYLEREIDKLALAQAVQEDMSTWPKGQQPAPTP